MKHQYTYATRPQPHQLAEAVRETYIIATMLALKARRGYRDFVPIRNELHAKMVAELPSVSSDSLWETACDIAATALQRLNIH